jgi:rhomboid family GlyGly-CTERM serine protease
MRQSLRFFDFRRLLAPGAVGGVALLLEVGGEPLRMALRYEREGIASGEIWRLVTGHLVHLGPTHAAMNVAALGVMAAVFTRFLTTWDWVVAMLVAALAIDAGLYALSPAVAWYVGLSGVLHGCWAAACVRAFAERPAEAWALTALILGKLAYETVSGPLTLTGTVAGGPVVAVAHAYGAVGGALAMALVAAIRPPARPL